MRLRYLKAILLLALALTGAATASSNGRQLMSNDKIPSSSVGLPTCPVSPPVTDTGLGPIKPMINVKTKTSGTANRNFTCTGDVPDTYSEYYADLDQVEGFWFGTLYYDANGFPTFDLTFQDPYNDYARTSRKVVTFKEFLQLPSPTGAAPWARYKVMSDTGSPPFSYVERRDTTGGVPPANCGGQNTISVPYTANYNFYMCLEGAAAPAPTVTPSPVAPIIPPPITPIIAPSPMPTPSPIPAPPSPVVIHPPPTVSPTAIPPLPSPKSSAVTAHKVVGVLMAVIAVMFFA